MTTFELPGCTNMWTVFSDEVGTCVCVCVCVHVCVCVCIHVSVCELASFIFQTGADYRKGGPHVSHT